MLLVRATYMGVILRAHPVRGESHIQRTANREVATAGSVSTKCQNKKHTG